MHRITDKLPNDLEKVLVYEVFERGHIGPTVERFTMINPGGAWVLGSITNKNHAIDDCQVWWSEIPELPAYEKNTDS